MKKNIVFLSLCFIFVLIAGCKKIAWPFAADLTPTATVVPGPVFTATPSSAWHLATSNAAFGGRKDHESVVYNNKMWVLGGAIDGNPFTSGVWSSSDGVTWIESPQTAPFAGRNLHISLVYDNKMWVMAGQTGTGDSSNDVWYSTDGASWTQVTVAAPFEPRHYSAGVVFQNKMWVIGGYDDIAGKRLNDVWNSADGSTWVQVTGTAAFTARNAHSCVVFDAKDGAGEKIWLIAGSDGLGTYKSDIWNTSDGITWNCVTSDADFPVRMENTTVVFAPKDGSGEKIWVIGGYDIVNFGNDYKHDVWYSSNGADWTLAEADAAFSKRFFHSSVVFNNKMWIMGGYGEGSYKSDAWWADDMPPHP